eukprot:6537203-Prorocentrum_lima.AAC.1
MQTDAGNGQALGRCPAVPWRRAARHRELPMLVPPLRRRRGYAHSQLLLCRKADMLRARAACCASVGLHTHVHAL